MDDQLASSGMRKREITRENTTEDQALDLIAREAEARLAAKRAARAEARSIRMKEIERKQKEQAENLTSETYNDGVHLNVRKNTRTGSIVSSFDTPDSILSSLHLTKEEQILLLKEMLMDREMRFNRAMITTAQLDNEKQALQYQLGAMKDIIEELQENVDDTADELIDKTRDYNKLSREFEATTNELNKCLLILAERDRVLDEHGINPDGTLKEDLAAE